MQLFRGFLSRGSAPKASHELQPWSLPLKKAGAGVSESAGSGGGESLPPVLQRYRRPRRGAGESLSSLADIWSAAPPSERCSCALRRLSPPPALLRCQAPPPPTPDALPAPRQVLGNFHGGPGPLARPGLLRLPRQDPCFPPLPEKKRTRFHQLIQRRAAAFRGARDFADKRPGIGGNQGLPSLPHPRNCLLRPVQMRDARLESAHLSPALVPRRQRQTIQ